MRDASSSADISDSLESKQIAKTGLKIVRPVVVEPAPDHANKSDAAEEDIALTLQRYAHLFLKQRWMILGVSLAFTAVGMLHALTATRLFTATTKIQIDFEASKIVDGDTTEQGNKASGADFQRTHYELLRSRVMAERVVSALRLQEDLAFLGERDQGPIGRIVNVFRSGGNLAEIPATRRASMAASIVSQHVEIKPIVGSRLINLSFTDPNPQRASSIANAYADAYIAANLEKRFQANSYAKIFLDDQIKQLKLRLEESETALIEFAEKEKIVQSADKTSAAENSLAAANAALGQLISERFKAEETWQQVEKATEINLPQILSNSAIDNLRTRRKELQREYQEKSAIFRPSYPAMVVLSNQIKEIDRQLKAEVAIIKASLEAAYRNALGQENEMTQQIEDLRNEVLDLQKKGFQQNILTREVETNRGLYNNLLQRYKEVDIASGVGTNNIFVIDQALVPASPSSPKVFQILIISMVLGLAAGLGLAYAVDIFDDCLRAPEEIEQVLGLPTLGVIPLVGSEEMLANDVTDPRSALSEAYRSLATALQFSTDAGVPRSMLVTSSAPGEGKSTTAVATARHFASMGYKVLLVDADLRRPSLHTRLGKSNDRGLSNFLSGGALAPELVQPTDLKTLKFIASGPMPPNAGDLLASSRVGSLISVGLKFFDLIIVDSPPVIGIADAQLLSGATAATVFVVSAGESRKRAVVSAMRRLTLARVRPIGVVLTKFDTTTVGYGYGYGYGSYSYGGEREALNEEVIDQKVAALETSHELC